MPRLDNTNQDIIDDFNLSFDEDDPVDLCIGCQISNYPEELIINSPSYEEGNYSCKLCGITLGSVDEY